MASEKEKKEGRKEMTPVKNFFKSHKKNI